MGVEDALKERVCGLIADAEKLSATGERGTAMDNKQATDCQGWVAAALNAVELACPQQERAYRREADRIANDPAMRGAMIVNRVASMSALLGHLLADIDNGLLTSVANSASAEVFDDFLDHGEKYLERDRKNEAGVIAGIVFEDSVRRICRSNGITEQNIKLDQLIIQLAKNGLLSGVKAKRARAAAGLRTSATHAQWEEFEAKDVRPVIDLARELISEHLDK